MGERENGGEKRDREVGREARTEIKKERRHKQQEGERPRERTTEQKSEPQGERERQGPETGRKRGCREPQAPDRGQGWYQQMTECAGQSQRPWLLPPLLPGQQEADSPGGQEQDAADSQVGEKHEEPYSRGEGVQEGEVARLAALGAEAVRPGTTLT